MSVTLRGIGSVLLGWRKMNPMAESSLAAGDDSARDAIDHAHSQFCKTRGIAPSQESIERFANHRTDYDAIIYEGWTRQQLVTLLQDKLPD